MSGAFDFAEISVLEIFGSNCFNDSAMKRLLPSHIYQELQQVRSGDKDLNPVVAEAVASAMKQWALEKGQLITPIGFNL